MPPPAKADIDRNLLFGVIALQDDFIDQAQFADVCAGWAMRMDRPLADLLKERGWLNDDDCKEIDRKLGRKLKKHRNDPRATLASMADAELRDALQSIANPDVHNTLRELAPATGHRLVETLVPPSDQRSSLRYTLSRMHAQGGLGKIWIARDTDLNREVALKEIRVERSANPDAWRRFMKEAQVTGQLEHPNIVPVYELARRKEDDQPFYTMRFVRGGTLRSAIAEFHQKRGRKALNRLELQRLLLEPFVKVCQAIAYAHSRGVIHRDLKPENVVLGSFGEVIVLDWGLAKILDESPAAAPSDQRVTVTADADTRATQGAIGTPSYMAPEQALGDSARIDTRTDIYGLGGILYEILTGKPPAQGDTLPDVISKVTTGRIDRARSVEPTVAKALDAICAKALALKPEDRYQKAEDLAEDVRRWLLDEPVSVFRDPPLVRAARWARRHRTTVATAAALLLTALVGLAAGLYFVNAERARTEAQRKIAVANEAQALKLMRLAQDSADTLLAEVADVDLAEIPQMESVRKRLLEKARGSYEQFLTYEGDDPMVKWGAGRALARLGDIQSLLGNGKDAEKSYLKAVEIVSGLSTSEPDNRDYTRDLARALHGLGVLLKDQTRYRAADESLRKAVALRAKLAAEKNVSADDEQALADSNYQLGALLARQGAGEADDAQLYQAALETQSKLADRFKDRPEYLARLARYRNNQGILLRAMGKYDEAGAIFLDTAEQINPEGRGQAVTPGLRWQYARACNNVAGVYRATGGGAGEASYLTKAKEILEALHAEFPEVAAYQYELAGVYHNFGSLRPSGSHGIVDAEALADFRRAVALMQQLRDNEPSNPSYRNRLASFRISLDELNENQAEAEAAVRKSIDDLKALVADYPDALEYQNTLLRSRYLLASLLMRGNQDDRSLAEVNSAIAAAHEVVARDPVADSIRRTLVELLDLKFEAYFKAKKWDEAALAAEAMPRERPDNLESYARAAHLLARLAREAPDQDFAKRAVDVLADSHKRGLALHPDHLSDPNFDILRERPDFKSLRERVTGGVVKG